MNPSRYEGNQKIIRIIQSETTRWESMGKDALIQELIEEKIHFLETELEYGNEEYLDELVEEIDTAKVVRTALGYGDNHAENNR